VNRVATLLTRLRLNSLAGRLIAAAAVWTVLALVGGGFVLSNAFRTSVQADFDSEMADDLDSLVAAAGHGDKGEIKLEQRYLANDYQRAYSGNYWQVVSLAEGTTLISHSLLDHTLKFSSQTPAKNNVISGYGDGPDRQFLRILARRIEFDDTTKPKPVTHAYMLYVAADTGELNQRIVALTAR
jgi:hypothetical protein